MKAALQSVAKGAVKRGRVAMAKQPLPPPISSSSSIPATATAQWSAAASLHTSRSSSSSSLLTRPMSVYALPQRRNVPPPQPPQLRQRPPPPFPSLSFPRPPSTLPTGALARRGITTQTSTPKRPRPSTSSPLPFLSPPRRHFWSPRFLRQLGLPWFAQAFYGTIFIIGVGVLATFLFATSTVFAVLFLVAFAGFKLLNRQPHLLRQVLRPKRGAPPSIFGPFVEMMSDGMLLDGLKNAREAVERDVLGAINAHPRLGKWGTDFRTTGLHKMNMRVLNGGEKHVVMEMVVVSSKQRELLVQVVASRQDGDVGVEEEKEEDSSQAEQWIYENVSIQTPDGGVLDLTDELVGGKTGKRIVIDVEPRRVKEEE